MEVVSSRTGAGREDQIVQYCVLYIYIYMQNLSFLLKLFAEIYYFINMSYLFLSQERRFSILTKISHFWTASHTEVCIVLRNIYKNVL